jgi:hypothetical protein
LDPSTNLGIQWYQGGLPYRHTTPLSLAPSKSVGGGGCRTDRRWWWWRMEGKSREMGVEEEEGGEECGGECFCGGGAAVDVAEIPEAHAVRRRRGEGGSSSTFF